jgi:hypothetical protein
MFEKIHEALASWDIFLIRLASGVLLGVTLITVAELFGMWGYHYYEGMNWIDSFANAAMILSGMGPLTPLVTTGGKLFAGFYALFSGLLFIAIIGIIFAPVVHRFFHKINLDAKKLERKK